MTGGHTVHASLINPSLFDPCPPGLRGATDLQCNRLNAGPLGVVLGLLVKDQAKVSAHALRAKSILYSSWRYPLKKRGLLYTRDDSIGIEIHAIHEAKK